jgi:thiosulfate dehydrogenase [quinone] large subunit
MARKVTSKSKITPKVRADWQNRLVLKGLTLTRIVLGFVFLWAFLDKLIGLGFATCRDQVSNAVNVGCTQSWLNGGSPTSGFLEHGTKGPFAESFQALAGNGLVDWLFMLGLLGIGSALMFGFAIRAAAVSGGLLLTLMWLATLWPETNPVIDDHVVYALILGVIYLTANQQYLSVRPAWRKLPVVKSLPWLW